MDGAVGFFEGFFEGFAVEDDGCDAVEIGDQGGFRIFRGGRGVGGGWIGSLGRRLLVRGRDWIRWGA